MWTIKRILVATDFSEGSDAALENAEELARAFKVPIVVLHAYQVPVYPYYGVPGALPADARLFEEAADAALKKQLAAHKTAGVEMTGLLRLGVAWEQIVDSAKQLDASLIVMGTQGRRGLSRALLGSVAEKVVRLSPVPVLTVHAAPDAPTAGG